MIGLIIMITEKLFLLIVMNKKMSRKKISIEEVQMKMNEDLDTVGGEGDLGISIEERIQISHQGLDKLFYLRLSRQRYKGQIGQIWERIFHLSLWLLLTQVAAKEACVRGICKTPCDFKGTLRLGQSVASVNVVNPLIE